MAYGAYNFCESLEVEHFQYLECNQNGIDTSFAGVAESCCLCVGDEPRYSHTGNIVACGKTYFDATNSIKKAPMLVGAF